MTRRTRIRGRMVTAHSAHHGKRKRSRPHAGPAPFHVKHRHADCSPSGGYITGVSPSPSEGGQDDDEPSWLDAVGLGSQSGSEHLIVHDLAFEGGHRIHLDLRT